MHKFRVAFLLLVLSFSECAMGQESMLPSVSNGYLTTIVEYAKINYPRLKKYRQKVDQTHYGITKAKLAWFEALTFSYTFGATNNTTQANPRNFLGTSQPGVFINVGTLMSKSPSLKIARLEKGIAESELAEMNQNIEAVVKERYYTYVQKLTILKIRSKYVDDAECSLKLVKYKFEKGEESFDNYTKALLLNSVSLQNKIESEGEVLIAKSNLEELLGKKLEEFK